MNNKGQGTLFISFDMVVSLVLFSLTFIICNAQILDYGADFISPDYPSPNDLLDTVFSAWMTLPFGFLLSNIVRSVYSKTPASFRTQSVWVFITLIMFGFCLEYLAFADFVENISLSFFSTDPNAVSTHNTLLVYWGYFPLGFALILNISGIVVQNWESVGYEKTGIGI